jgi:ubiquinone/menaquinone biosynthesis C-methylase UbiE
MAEVTYQYDVMGKDYLHVQQTVHNESNFWGRAKVSEYVGSMQGQVVIDAGCGGGHDALTFAEQGASSVLAFDPSEVMLIDARALAAQKGIDTITYSKGTFESVPFADNCAEIMVGIFSLHYVADLDAAYNEMYRVLKPGGKIAFICSHPEDMTAHKTSAFKGQEVVAIKIYSDTVTVHQPSHTMSEYFSPTFLKLFQLNQLDEFFPVDDAGNTLKNPVLFVFGATKK